MEHIKKWNPRYLAYCRANHYEPDVQNAIDRKQYPGGFMTGFILWNNLHWALFFKEVYGIDNYKDYVKGEDTHKQYDNFLLHYYPES